MVLPGVMCCPVHLPLAAEAWDVVRLLPVNSRFQLYADLKVWGFARWGHMCVSARAWVSGCAAMFAPVRKAALKSCGAY